MPKDESEISNFQLKEENEKWICACGILHKIRKNNKPCPHCNDLPKEDDKNKASRSRLLRHL